MVETLRTLLVDIARLCLWLAMLSIVFLPLERRFALRPGGVFRQGLAADLAYYFLNGMLPKLLLILPTAALALAVHRLIPPGYLAAVSRLPLWWRIPLVLVVGELGFYWGHRWSHEWPWLWRFHAIHHSPEQVNWLVNTRAHPVDVVFTRLCGLVPIYLLGLAQVGGQQIDLASILVILFGTFWGFFIHANVRWRLGWLEWLVATPAFHHWHHTNDEHRDRNYAAMLPWLDHVFGSFHLPATWPPNYGVDRPVPSGLARQLLLPLASHRV
jgi:sterol desaturase/sphingolipid hydroxylase (fatty acid hydroxylase superfamily)